MIAAGKLFAAASALWLAALAPASRADDDARLTVRADPATLVLETDPRATLQIEVGGEVPPLVTASVGRIEGVRALGSGRFAADYFPPREAYPQVAIVAALAGDRLGWTAIPLVGRGIAIAHSAPRSSIRVTIAEASFGPVVADARGEAHVPVIVPPGVRFAYHRGQPLELKIPPTPRVHLRLARNAAPADAAQAVPLFALAVTPGGAPQRGAQVEVSVSEGAVEGLREIAPGTFAGTWRLPAGRAVAAVATARLADDVGPPSTAKVERPPGAPAHVALEPARSRFTAGEGGRLALRIHVTDAAGNDAEAQPRVEATFGTASPPAPAGAGRWEATLALPPAFGSSRSAEVVARAGAVEHRVTVELAPGPPERLALVPASATVVADGGTEARVAVRVVDRFGNDVPTAPPAVESTRGAGLTSQRDEAGRWVVRVRPPRTREPAEEIVSVRAGELAATARLDLLAPERRLTLAPVLGFAASAGGVRSPSMGVQAGYWTSRLDGRLGVAADFGTFAHDRTDVALVDGRELSIHGHARYVPVLASVRWRERLGRSQVGWVSLGAGLAIVSASVSASGSSSRDQAGTVPALQASAAFGRRVGRGIPFGELRLSWHADARFDAVRGSLAVLTLAVGYAYDAR